MKQVFYNGKIHAMSAEDSYYDYMIVEDHYISELGHGLPDTIGHAIDLKGKFVCPSFIDTHMHLLGYGSALNKCQLDHCRSIKDLQDRLLKYKDRHSEYWIEGRGWNHDLFDEKRLPTKVDLDAICPDRPIILSRACGHIAVVNSLALEICGITSNTLISGGAVDVEDGTPTGILRENALTLVLSQIPLPTKSQLIKYFEDAQRQVLKYGITTVHTDDLTMLPEDEQINLIELMKALPNYPLRIYEQVQCLTPESIKAFSELGLVTGAGDHRFKIGPLKILADGSLGSRTARLSKPYMDDPKVQGILIYTEAELEQLVKLGIEHHFDLAIHAIGDYTNALSLKFIEKYDPSAKQYNAIVHSQIMTLPLIEKMAALKVNALVQPVFLGYDMFIVKDRVGDDLSQNSYAYKTMRAHGIKLGFGSDCPVESPNPFESLHYAVTRRHPSGKCFNIDEGLSVYDALSCFTKDAAYFSHESHLKGQLKKGYLADFVILSADPFVDDLLNITVEKTFIDGECVYSAEV